MALVDNAFYINYGNGSSTGWWAVTAWAASASKVCGNLVRQLAAPTAGNERVFVCISSTGGTGQTGGSEPAWTLTRGAKTTDNTLVFQEATGVAALNGDLTNTPNWNVVKNTVVTQGQVIKNVAGTLILIASVGGTAGNGAEPSWAAFTNAGATTADNTVTWVTLGASFTNWGAPHARIASAQATNWGQNGNRFFVNSASAETIAAAVNYGVGTAALPAYVLCVASTPVPPTATTTGASVTFTSGIPLFGSNTGTTQFWDGINISNSGANSLQLAGTNNSEFNINNATIATTNVGINVGAQNGGTTLTASTLRLNNVTFSFSATGQGLFLTQGKLTWKNNGTAGLAGAAVPTTLFVDPSSATRTFTGLIQGVDLSAAGAGKFLVPTTTSSTFYIQLVECKLNASFAIGTPGVGGDASIVDLVNCDSGAVNYRNERYSYAGTATTETTIVRTGGASDGVTQASRKIVTTANSLWAFPFNDGPVAIWNEVVGSAITVTLYGIWGGGAVPNNDDFWIDVDYLGSSGSPVASRATSGKTDFLAAGAALSSDASSWGGSTTAFKTSVTITPQMKGFIYVNPKAAKASSTFYYDPKLSVV